MTTATIGDPTKPIHVMCQPHAARLAAQIVMRGLEGLCAKDGGEIARKVESVLTSGVRQDNYDPFGLCQYILTNHAVIVLREERGMGQNDWDGCPICKMHEFCGCGRGIDCLIELETVTIAQSVDEAYSLGVKCGAIASG